MLLQVTIENFRSFREPACLSLTVPPGRVLARFPGHYTALPGNCRALKSAVLAGRNASGKTNFVAAMAFLNSMFRGDAEPRALASDETWPVLLAEPGRPSPGFLPSRGGIHAGPPMRFVVEYAGTNGIIYQYDLVLDREGIVSERLSSRRALTRRFRRLFEAERNPGGTYRVRFNDTEAFLRRALMRSGEKGLFMTKLAMLGYEHAAEAVRLMGGRISAMTPGTGEPETLCWQMPDLEILRRPEFLEIIRMADPSVCGIEPAGDVHFGQTKIFRESGGANYAVRLSAESDGLREFFFWARQVYRVVYENGIVFADAMDRAMHPEAAGRVFSLVNASSHQGQLIFTSHNPLHLDFRKFMRNQIVLVKRGDQGSVIDTLSDRLDLKYKTPKLYEMPFEELL